MGGGASLMEDVDQLLTTTILIGRAISAVNFPGMYRIYDFHSKMAPKLKNAQQFSFFGPPPDDLNDGNDASQPDPADYSHFFNVKVGEDIIYLEDPCEANEEGWTPLHSCCMSLATVDAGIKIIDEIIRSGASLEMKTKAGPGTFNSGWTALHMACAYGVEPLVEKLVQSGADVNSVNSFGYSCLLEASHRGYIVVAKSLMTGPTPVDFSYIPSEEQAASSPFSGAPCQSALAEAARCGFYKVVQELIDHGAPKDLPNELGWTALHEACFYNRMETVKTLLLAGADPTLRTNSHGSRRGALPYHLASIVEIRTMLSSIGGPAAAPEDEDDKVDMMMILTELTMPASFRASGGMDGPNAPKLVIDGNGNATLLMPMDSDSKLDNDDDDDENDYAARDDKHSVAEVTSMEFAPKTSKGKSAADSKPTHRNETEMKQLSASNETAGGKTSSTRGKLQITQDEGEAGLNPLLHKGGVLGDLPALKVQKTSPSKHVGRDLDAALALAPGGSSNSGVLSGAPIRSTSNLSRAADDKMKPVAAKRASGNTDAVPKDMPASFICQLTQRPMSEPVKTIYGNIYDKTAIVNWLNTQGRVCPLTGAPLSQVDLQPIPELQSEIRQWILKRSLATSNQTASVATAADGAKAATTTTASAARGSSAVGSSVAAEDDLYDF